ncbi:hypothetical protein BC936DRAFT_147205 [Jimgerdemannia flammicorona]|uniref:Alpha/Beta hydrolase protein n=1 Tax=Jimgerdemannia flammicorona TaxID=994334 RepID=A0A433D5W8_9FUNG|nr:hypothetical protein BC936DRAFT_147205 [Jimgerdemannia flammicorona]
MSHLDHLIRTEKAKVAFGRDSKPLTLYYEIHGTGPKRICLVMGLNTTCRGWDHQVAPLYFPVILRMLSIWIVFHPTVCVLWKQVRILRSGVR